MNKHQYESAVYIGDKLLALTSPFFLWKLHTRPELLDEAQPL